MFNVVKENRNTGIKKPPVFTEGFRTTLYETYAKLTLTAFNPFLPS